MAIACPGGTGLDAGALAAAGGGTNAKVTSAETPTANDLNTFIRDAPQIVGVPGGG
ncbi:hypothetical protein Rhe02_56050 [Rhizocola hellebori]|uniref:Uncharacterized protein n=1 Tax=Rhizocola hellebori TaxID=1392758 RepID=A0A8J3QD67_9ACTN|nr:hypothetical protein Rhe02_56050 [Rhizocola hellebori]